MTLSNWSLWSPELVQLECSVSSTDGRWPLSGTAFCAVRRFRRQSVSTVHPGDVHPLVSSWQMSGGQSGVSGHLRRWEVITRAALPSTRRRSNKYFPLCKDPTKNWALGWIYQHMRSWLTFHTWSVWKLLWRKMKGERDWSELSDWAISPGGQSAQFIVMGTVRRPGSSQPAPRSHKVLVYLMGEMRIWWHLWWHSLSLPPSLQKAFVYFNILYISLIVHYKGPDFVTSSHKSVTRDPTLSLLFTIIRVI